MTISTILPLLESFTQSSKTRDQDDNDKCALIELFEKSTDFSRTLSAGAEQKIVELLLRQKTAEERRKVDFTARLGLGTISWSALLDVVLPNTFLRGCLAAAVDRAL
jgi:hypothetical protein